MKKIIMASILILLQGCGSQISTARLLSSPTTTPSIELSHTFPLVWTATPSPFQLATTIPMNTNTPNLSQTHPPKGNFDPSTKTLITFVNDGWIYAADWEGQITPLWNLANDNIINAGEIHMEISPDRKSLAFSGIGNNGDPSLEVLDLSTLMIKDQITFKGNLVTDYAWASDSHKIVASIATFHNNLVFDTSVAILDLSNILTRNNDFVLSNRIISQIEWPLTSNILYTDYSCEADQKVEPPPVDDTKYGISGIGLYDIDSKKTTHRNMVATVEWPGVKFTVSPDASRILFFSWLPGLTQPGINIMLSMKSLNSIPCSFCGGFF